MFVEVLGQAMGQDDDDREDHVVAPTNAVPIRPAWRSPEGAAGAVVLLEQVLMVVKSRSKPWSRLTLLDVRQQPSITDSL
jgi:hypothetical protein